MKTLDAVTILHNIDVKDKMVSSALPYDINRNVCFLLNTKAIGHWKNALSDCMGTWTQTYTQTRKLARDRTGFEYTSDRSQFTVYRHQYRNNSEDLHGIIIRLEINNSTWPFMFVQYYFDADQHTVKVKPHGSSSHSHPYIRTQHSTKEKMKTLTRTQKPKEVFHSLINEKGGIDQISSPSEIARNLQQIYNLNRSKAFDPLLDVLDMAKQNPSFIRDLEMIPEFMFFLANDEQLHDVERFCTNGNLFNVLGVDTTFNIGKYYLTMTTYRNLMMINKKKGHEPIMIGPSILHQRRTFGSFFHLASGMIKHRLSLLHIQVIGTNGDENLHTSMLASLPFADHLLCDMHIKGNITTKLTSLGIKRRDSKLFFEDIFGSNIETDRVPGLAVCCDKEEFMNKLSNLKSVWKERHPKGTEFFKYLEDHKAPLIANCMTANLRAKCGMGFPPKPYTQNANESINSKVKKDLGKNRLSEPEFIK